MKQTLIQGRLEAAAKELGMPKRELALALARGGDTLKELVARFALSSWQLADLLGVYEGNVARANNGSVSLNWAWTEALVEELGEATIRAIIKVNHPECDEKTVGFWFREYWVPKPSEVSRRRTCALWLREARKRLGMSREELAEAIKIRPAVRYTLEAVERGEMTLPAGWRQRIIKLLMARGLDWEFPRRRYAELPPLPEDEPAQPVQGACRASAEALPEEVETVEEAVEEAPVETVAPVALLALPAPETVVEGVAEAPEPEPPAPEAPSKESDFTARPSALLALILLTAPIWFIPFALVVFILTPFRVFGLPKEDEGDDVQAFN